MDLKTVHALMAKNKFVEAKAVLLGLSEKFPEFPLYKLKLKECEDTLTGKVPVNGLDQSKALRDISRDGGKALAIDSEPGILTSNNRQELEAFAKSSLANKDLKQAALAYEKLYRLDKTAVPHLCLSAEIDLQCGEFEGALRKAEEAIAEAPQFRKGYKVAEQASIELGRFEIANQFFLNQPPVDYPETPRKRGPNPILSESFVLPDIVGAANDYTHILEQASVFKASGKPYKLTASIIIPVYNRHQILANTLAALLHQTYPRELMQIIVVDDGSSDAFLEVVKKYEDDLDITVVRQPDKGFRVAAGRNLGIRLSKGEAIIFMDADILPCPADVENYMRVLHVNDHSVLIGHRRYVDVSGITDDQIASDITIATSLPSINPNNDCLLYTSPSPRDQRGSRMPSSA